MDFLENRKGIALGKVATDSDLLDINFPVKFRKEADISSDFTINGKTIFDLIYPIGSIYMSVNETDPSLLFGGTWAAWSQGRVPVGVNLSGTFNVVEKTGGSETHTLAITEMPSHTHTQNSHRHDYGRPALFGGPSSYKGHEETQ